MKISLVMGSALAAVFVSSICNAAVTKYTAVLNGAQENPPVATAATGAADLDFDDFDNSLKGKITLVGLTESSAQHVHKGACGDNGAVEFALGAKKNDEVTVNETLSGAQATALAAGELYINFHTTANPGGEIRGQLYAVGSGKTCPPGSGDAGAEAGTDAGGTSTSSSGGSTTTSSGATTTRPDAGDTADAAPEDDGGCSTTGSGRGSSNGVAIAIGLGVALAGFARARKKTR
jgi:hypothetical protein